MGGVQKKILEANLFMRMQLKPVTDLVGRPYLDLKQGRKCNHEPSFNVEPARTWVK